MRRFLPFLFLLPAAVPALALEIAHEKHVLSNGLQVLLHEDHSDPLVAVYVYYHVGSGREEPGRSGFAHLFEHVMFQGSAHVGDDMHFKLIQEAGGSLNGTTNGDRTNYYQVLPSNQLELALWLESDRMGFLLPAVTQANLDNQREVVKNERRQNYENRPYAQSRELVARLLYPPEHPYSWITIGSMEDLSAASLDDVHAFFKRWYGPNNATLAIGGDIDPGRTLALVEKYFGPIPRGPQVDEPKPWPARLQASRREAMEDRVQLPQLSTAWPGVEMGHPDEAALDLLAAVLSRNDNSVLDKALMLDERLASEVSSYHHAQEMAGTFTITMRPLPGIRLDDLEGRMHRLLARFAEEGVGEERLTRLKNSDEAARTRRLETVSGRTGRLGSDNTFFGEPDRVQAEIDRMRAVTPADLQAVLRRYVLNRPFVAVSVVPTGRLDMAATGEGLPAVEPWLDRSSRPIAGATPAFRPPALWHGELANGVKVVGTVHAELPMSTFTLSVPAGRAHESLDDLGISSLTAEMLQQGTRRLSAAELADEIAGLGATVSVGVDMDDIVVSVTALDRFLPSVAALLAEVLLEPRFAASDFDRIVEDRLTALDTRSDQIRAVAADAWARLHYGKQDVRGYPEAGTRESVESMTVQDVERFWAAHARPGGARLVFVGARDERGVRQLFKDLGLSWKEPRAQLVAARPELAEPALPEGRSIYLVDRPGAPQSEIRIGHAAVPETHPDHYRLAILNHPLGGSFSSRVNLNLREDKGYTYGARTGFQGDRLSGQFVASTGVRTDATAASVAELMKELEGMAEGPTEAELAFTKDSLIQGMNRQYESARALAGMLSDVGRYGWPDDYPVERRRILESIQRKELAELAKRYLHPERSRILVVGDASAVRGELEALGYGPVHELDVHGSPVETAESSASFFD